MYVLCDQFIYFRNSREFVKVPHFFVVSISVPITHYYLTFVRNLCESPSEWNSLVIQR